MKSKRWCLFFAGALFLALANLCPAQRGPNWRTYKAADGLPESFITSITLGPHDHLWLRHPSVEWIGWVDGYEVRAIPAPGLGNNPVYESPGGQIWSISHDGLQLYQSQQRSWIDYSSPRLTAELRRITTNGIRSLILHPSKQNHVLVLAPDGLIECNSDSGEYLSASPLRTANQSGLERFLGVSAARDGGLWISGEKGLAKVPGPTRNIKRDTSWEEHLAPEELQVHNLREPTEDDDGGVTMLAEAQDGTRQWVVYFDGKVWLTYGVPGEKIIHAWRSGDTFWASTAYSLLKLSPGQKQFTPIDEISQNRYFDYAVEPNGVFWLASSDGLIRYAPLPWRAPSGIAELNHSPIAGLNEATNGRLFALSDSSVFLMVNDKWTNVALPAEASVENRETRSTFVLANGELVMEANSRLLAFNSINGQFQFPIDTQSVRSKPLGLLRDGTLGVLTVNMDGKSRIQTFDGTNFTTFPYPQPEMTSAGEPQSLVVLQSGDVWLSFKNGLACDHEGKWQHFSAPAPAGSNAPIFMLDMGDGKIWCGIQDVIHEFDGKVWSTVRSGFYRINAMIHAKDGSVWVASESGLHRFFRGTWMANGVEEGLGSTAVREVFQDHLARIWVGTSRGLNLYHPEADPDAPRTSVQNLPFANNTVPEGQVVTLAFSAQDKWKYSSEDRLLYSYELDGMEWSPYQEQRGASFLDLAAGKHSFRVRSMDRNWNVDPQPALLQFVVAAPWYRESRLMLISGLGLGTAIFFAGLAINRHLRLLKSYAEVEAKVALRTKQLQQANDELLHSQKMNALGTLAAGIAHDFNNILSIIKGSAQIIEDNLENQSKIRTRTDRIKMVVDQGAGIVKAMLGFSRGSDRQLTMCDVSAVVRETITLLGDRFLREMEVVFHPAVISPPKVVASKDFIQQILLNLIFNAADASTGGKRVILSVGQTGELPPVMALKPQASTEYVFIAVKDFGAGIAPEIMPRIFEPFFTTKSLSVRRGTGLGLSMAYELARQMDCGLGVESVLGQGSTFTIYIPIRPMPMDAKTENR